MMQEAISIISIMLGVVILTAWVMWLLLRKSGDDLAMRFDRDAAKDQLTRGVMHINALENENRLLKKVLDDLNEKGLVGATEMEASLSQKDIRREGAPPTSSEASLDIGSAGVVGGLPPTSSEGSVNIGGAGVVGGAPSRRKKLPPDLKPPTHTLESAQRKLRIDALDRSIPPAPKKLAPKPSASPPQKDDLTKIKGIGPVLQVRLNKLGITRYQQIAGLRDEDLDKVNDAIGMVKGRIRHLGWRKQAQVLAYSNKTRV